MPVPIPQETDPFAEPGEWVFINKQWLIIVLGTLSYALNDWYWTGSQDETSGVIQSTLKLIDGIGALLPPETVREITEKVYIYTESEPFDDGDVEMCKCGNCGSAVYYDLESKKKYVMSADCQRVYIEESTTTPELGGLDDWENAGEPPVPADLPSFHDLPEYRNNSEAMQCAKATAIVNEMWNLLSVYTAAEGGMNFLATVDALLAWAEIQFPVTIPAAVAAGWATFLTTFAAIAGFDAIVDEMQPIYDDSDLKNEIICKIVDKMVPPEKVDLSWFGADMTLPVKTSTVYAEDIKAAMDVFKELRPAAKISSKWIGLFPLKSWREIVTVRIPETLCACEDYAPSEPPPEVPEGYGQLKLEIVRAYGVDANPAAAGDPTDLRTQTPNGTITDDGYETAISTEAFNQGLGMLVSVPAGFKIDRIYYKMWWIGTGTGLGSGKQVAEGIYGSTGGTDDFTTLSENAGIDASYIASAITAEGALTAKRYIYISYETIATEEGDPPAVRIYDLFFDVKKDGGGTALIKIAPGTIFPL